MTPFEFAMGLVSIVVGIAVSDIAVSMHKLMRRGGSVRWDSRVVATALLSFLLILQLWFATWTLRDISEFPFPLYLAILFNLFQAYLVAAACLPDEPVEDLRMFYESNARYFRTITTVFQVTTFAIASYFVFRRGFIISTDLPLLARWLLPTAMSLTLALKPHGRLLHLSLTTASILWFLIHYWNRSL
jgi:phage shock protein PspC (stress-responsive transcriptional regulator)